MGFPIIASAFFTGCLVPWYPAQKNVFLGSTWQEREKRSVKILLVSLTHSFASAGDGNFIYSQADENQKGKVARLVSPVVYSQSSAHCMTFWYHMSGSHVGTLRVKLRYQKPEEYDQLVWMVVGHQGDHWKEGRVLLHKSLKLYQVCTKGGLRFSGHWDNV
jgi:hypothetical protein